MGVFYTAKISGLSPGWVQDSAFTLGHQGTEVNRTWLSFIVLGWAWLTFHCMSPAVWSTELWSGRTAARGCFWMYSRQIEGWWCKTSDSFVVQITDLCKCTSQHSARAKRSVDPAWSVVQIIPLYTCTWPAVWQDIETLNQELGEQLKSVPSPRFATLQVLFFHYRSSSVLFSSCRLCIH